MTGRVLLLLTIVAYSLAYLIYGKYLKKIFAIDPARKTPAHTRRDDIDFIPAPKPILFGHHFASIAGAGPIVGPVLAACFGWGPVALWIILGCIFVGAVHDFSALMASIRNNGQTIGHIVEKYISYTGRQIFLLFCCAALILIVAIFALLIAKTFVASPAVAMSSILFIILAVIFGILCQQGKLSLLMGSIVFVPLLFLCVYIGAKFPFDISALFGLSSDVTRIVWTCVLFSYAFIASVLPVWLLLQPRDYLNSFLLYAMILLGIISILVINPAFHIPFFEGFRVPAPASPGTQWSLFPILFVTVACGACSGFHSLVSSGTTAKQIDNERDAFPIGYGAMILEGVLGIITLISISVLTKSQYLEGLASLGPVNIFSNGLANLSAEVGLPFQVGQTFVALTISAFMLTTLDTATRLTRFTIHEMVLPKNGDKPPTSKIYHILRNRYWATGIVIMLAGYLALSGDAGRIWPVFGASNQLLAALTLLVLTIIFIVEKKNIMIVFLPFVIMLLISGWALAELFFSNFKAHQWTLSIASGFLLVMALILTLYAFCHLRAKKLCAD